MTEHDLRFSEGQEGDSRSKRPFWYCTCSRFCGGNGIGWVCFLTQPRQGMKAGKPERPEAERLHRRHIENSTIPEEEL